MVRFLVLYPTPINVEAFEKHYFEVHAPLAKQLPGLRRYTVSRNASPVRGSGPYYLVAELDWDDMDSLRRDFGSPLGLQTARDADTLTEWCPAIHSMIFELEDLREGRECPVFRGLRCTSRQRFPRRPGRCGN
jgi:uncharacterized protein (TIGR02118 family)